MPRRPRRNHTPAFKSKVALAAIRGDKTVSELAQQFDVHPNQITLWKNPLLERASEAFEGGGRSDAPSIDVKALHAKIGELAMEFAPDGLQYGGPVSLHIWIWHRIRRWGRQTAIWGYLTSQISLLISYISYSISDTC